MFVPATPEGTLKKMLQEMDANMKFSMKCKYVETRGVTLQAMLFKTDPWCLPCGRNCKMCESMPGKCTKKNAIYRYDCKICEEEDGRPTSYIGQTARTGFERGEEHRKAMENEDPESPFVEHQQEKHPGEPIQVTMKLLKKVIRPLDRKESSSPTIQKEL